ncbi:hypothetical protein CEXT_324331 [Caerostris extrusa]|uniref:Uncharacterized protein n=1 Tax=Caerostris extrusa TaxID=172846 RepID=A0AAV4VAN9_CAEEX|nr:hypothetical protein CEXT_324331 [Caerostris extrusa]
MKESQLAKITTGKVSNEFEVGLKTPRALGRDGICQFAELFENQTHSAGLTKSQENLGLMANNMKESHSCQHEGKPAGEDHKLEKYQNEFGSWPEDTATFIDLSSPPLDHYKEENIVCSVTGKSFGTILRRDYCRNDGLKTPRALGGTDLSIC